MAHTASNTAARVGLTRDNSASVAGVTARACGGGGTRSSYTCKSARADRSLREPRAASRRATERERAERGGGESGFDGGGGAHVAV